MKSNRSILLVEDDQVDVMTMKRIMKKLNVKNPLHICENGEDALKWLGTAEQKPCLILLDLNMPRMNGLEFLQIVKQNETLKIIPVVVLTTSADIRDRSESFKNNAAGYMLKSLDYNEFTQRIAAIHSYWTHSELAY